MTTSQERAAAPEAPDNATAAVMRESGAETVTASSGNGAGQPSASAISGSATSASTESSSATSASTESSSATSASTESASAESASTAGTAAVRRWRPSLLWRFTQLISLILVPMVCDLRVTGRVPKHLRRGPLILAGNHISNFDPIAFTAASRRRGLAPRMMAAGGIFRAPFVGWFMRTCGHIPVYRHDERVAKAVPDALAALTAGSVVFIYPEGRIGLDPGMWPERPKTGVGRLALATRVPVVPVVTWGAHEVIPYHGWAAMVFRLATAFHRRPVVRVHFGDPVDLSDLRAGVVGDAQRASNRIMDAITVDLARLRADEPRLPRYHDPTRPVSSARLGRRAAPSLDAQPGHERGARQR